MKKLAAVALAVVGFAISGYSQGTVLFANNASSLVTTAGVSSPINSVTVGLYAGPSESSMTLVATVDIFPVPGRFNGGTVVLDGIAGGETATLQLRAWSTASGFNNYEEAFASGNPAWDAGVSSIWTQATGNPNSEPPGTPTAITPGFTGMDLQPIPEPSTVLLAVLGGLGLLLFRRRK